MDNLPYVEIIPARGRISAYIPERETAYQYKCSNKDCPVLFRHTLPIHTFHPAFCPEDLKLPLCNQCGGKLIFDKEIELKEEDPREIAKRKLVKHMEKEKACVIVPDMTDGKSIEIIEEGV